MKFTEFEKGLKLEGTVLDRRRKITPEEADTIRELRAQGVTGTYIAKKYNISTKHVYRLCDKNIYLKDIEFIKKSQAKNPNLKALKAEADRKSREYKKSLYNVMCLAK